MPVIQGSSDKMFFENAHIRHPRRYHEAFLRSRPYRGELPTAAGLLLYPDTPTKMETTTQEAFCFRRPQQHRDKGPCTTQRTRQESLHPPPTSSSYTRGKGSRIGSSRPRDDEQGADHDHTTSATANNGHGAAEMKSQYQEDFPAPPPRCRRGTPARPQPDNIGINPAFRIEFNTIQREAFPGWPVTTPLRPGRLSGASSRQPNLNSEYLFTLRSNT
ncbi:uncharacterized protein si:dkeyp-69c1.9 [Cololabis saira]|uniref:uncharacterized protein si:dkeyp-69c1.9 n=1 Tax=Cololabis saira TaxID=129043 RepID=UPI002AD2391C|nr:uncharacterized protein si:dkeyp-69c1.9 [Cololabis saira]